MSGAKVFKEATVDVTFDGAFFICIRLISTPTDKFTLNGEFCSTKC